MKQKIIKTLTKNLGIFFLLFFAIVFNLTLSASAEGSYWKNYFSSGEQRAIEKNSESYTLSQIESKSGKWKGIIRGYNIKNGSIDDEDIKDNGISTDKISGLDEYIDQRISGNSTPQDFAADRLTGSYAALNGSQITNLSPTNITGSGNLSITGNGNFSGSLNTGDVTTTRSNLGLQYSLPEDIENNTNMAAWGDSLTQAGYPKYLAAISGYEIYDGGSGGETSTQIKDRMIAATNKHSWATIIWAGRNNFTNPSTVKADIASMVNILDTDNYIVLGILNSSTEIAGSSNYNTIVQLNNELSEIYNEHFIDIRSYLVASYNSSISQDVTDHSNDIVPSSLRSDIIHLNVDGQRLVAQKIFQNISMLRNDPKILRVSDVPQLLVGQTMRGSVFKAANTIESFTGTVPLAITTRDDGNSFYTGIDFGIDSVSSNPIARIAANKRNDGSYLQFGTSFDWSQGVTTSGMTIDPHGRVGIGTTAPTLPFVVSGYMSTNRGKVLFMDDSGGFYPSLLTQATIVGNNPLLTLTQNYNYGNGSAGIEFNTYGTGGKHKIYGSPDTGPYGSGLIFEAGNMGSIGGGTFFAKFSESGNLGVGTTDPKTKLEVDGIIKTKERSTATCNADAKGGIYFDSDDNHFYGCNGTTWVQLDN